MNSKVLLNIFFLIGALGIHAQQNSRLGFDNNSNNDLFDKDWSDFDHLTFRRNHIDRDYTDFQFDFQKPLAALALNDHHNSETSKRKVIEMPIYEPSGNHSMKMYQPDSTLYYHMRIIDPD